jgi:glycosyltransferase involved in cell wall biosynthesis
MRRIVFVNSTSDTFTPTHSGAFSTWIWELCQCALKDGIEPLVITKTYGVEPYPWKNTVLLEYPKVAPIRGLGKLYEFEKRLTGWGHIRQRAYICRVEQAIVEAGAQEAALVLVNDIELAVYLSGRFPKAFVLHDAQNCNPCSEKFRRQFASAVSCAAAVSQHTATWNEEYFHFEPGGIKVLYNGVNCDVYSPAAALPADPIRINFVGRTGPEKGPDLLLKAALKLAKKHKGFEIQILGSNHFGHNQVDRFQIQLADLIEQVRSAGVHVDAPGFVNRWDLPDLLRRAHIHVMPSRWDEPFGLATLEGMACGLPTVAANVGGIPEIVAQSGLLFERDNVDQLAAHLDRLLSDAGLREEYGRKARARALEFNWHRAWERLLELTQSGFERSL